MSAIERRDFSESLRPSGGRSAVFEIKPKLRGAHVARRGTSSRSFGQSLGQSRWLSRIGLGALRRLGRDQNVERKQNELFGRTWRIHLVPRLGATNLRVYRPRLQALRGATCWRLQLRAHGRVDAAPYN